MKERPILFSGPMVRAILEGRKTQTRRILKRKFPFGEIETTVTSLGGCPVHFPDGTWEYEWCPYGLIGQHLWVRETWRTAQHPFPIGYPYEYRATAEADMTPVDGKWKPSIFMPRAASRITLEITNIRCEQLFAISESDAIAEGVEKCPDGSYKHYGKTPGKYNFARFSYTSLWDQINGEGAWEQNPFVWVIEFKVL